MAIQVTSATDAPQTPKAEPTPKAGEAIQSREDTKSAPEQNAQEQNEAEESDTTATEEVNSDKVEDNESESDENEGKDAQDKKDQPKKKSGFQRRIDKLNARMRGVEEEREYWRTQALQKNGAGDKSTETVQKTKTSDGKPIPDNFETHAEYVDALTDWKIDQKESARKADEAKSKLKDEHETLLKSHYEREKAFAANVDDYVEALEELDSFRDASPTLFSSITESDHGPALMYELAKNPAEYKRINALPPLACARELGKLEAKVAANSSAEKKTKEPNTITKAPKPIDPVGKNTKASVKKSIDDPNLTQSEYEQLRREQIKRKAG